MIDLFGGNTPQQDKPRKLLNQTGHKQYGQLIQIHGEKTGLTCKTCKHLCRFQYSQRFYKCAIADPGFKSGPSGDWRVGYKACGLHEIEVEHKPLNK